MVTDEERAELEIEFRRKYRLCEKGHKKGINIGNSCWTCKNNERRESCPHTSRYWYNPSNLPGDNRFMCSSCGKGMLPPPEA